MIIIITTIQEQYNNTINNNITKILYIYIYIYIYIFIKSQKNFNFKFSVTSRFTLKSSMLWFAYRVKHF